MTESQLTKAKEIQTNIEKQQKDIETLGKLMWYGRTDCLIVSLIKRFVCKLHLGYGAMSYNCNLSADELHALAEYKSEKILKLKKELSEL